MIRTLYHGSPRIVRTPGFGGGNAGNDFGILAGYPPQLP